MVVLVSGIFIYRHLKHQPLLANPGPLTATLSVRVVDHGQAGLGKLMIDGDCPTNEVTGIAGIFSCQLSHTPLSDDPDVRPVSDITINHLLYRSYIQGEMYSLPLTPVSSSQPIIVQPNTQLSLQVTVNTDDSVSLQQWVNGSLVDISQTGVLNYRKGTIKQIVNTTGTFYGITGGGSEFDPTNLDPAFDQDGEVVLFDYIPDDTTVTNHNFGTVVQLTHIEKVN